MLMDLSLKISQEQKLIMTQQMQLSINLLQMSTYDLREYIEKEFSENPVLDAEYNKTIENKKEKDKIEYKEFIKHLELDNYGSKNYGEYNYEEYNKEDISPFTFISKPKSLTEYLKEQILELPIDNYLKTICEYMIENLDNKGYLSITLKELQKEINCSSDIIERSLIVLHNLEPVGIGAKDLKECLMLQLKRRGKYNEIVEKIVNNHLENLADNKYQKIARELHLTIREAQKYGDLIKELEPKPSRGFYTGEEVKYIIPDAEIRKIDKNFFVLMNNTILPKLSINKLYNNILKEGTDDQTTEYIKEKMRKAIFLINSIEQRKNTLHKVLEIIVEKQKDYFDKGSKYLKPMALKEIAKDMNAHESTVSRAIKDKYVLTSFGTIKIRDLFTNGIHKKLYIMGNEKDIAVSNVKIEIKELINNENKSKPFSDQAICEYLNNKGIEISRRTIAKYREEIGIKSSSKRKRF